MRLRTLHIRILAVAIVMHLEPRALLIARRTVRFESPSLMNAAIPRYLVRLGVRLLLGVRFACSALRTAFSSVQLVQRIPLWILE